MIKQNSGGGLDMIRNCLVTLLILVFIPSFSGAAEIFLKDGGRIRCLFAEQQGETVYVLVNRDTEVELDRRNVDIKKTFKQRKIIGSFRRYKVNSGRER